MHNFGTVVRFEIVRTLKKPSFWLSILSFPLIFAVIFGIIYFSNQSSEAAKEEESKKTFSLVIRDETSLISNESVSALKGTKIDSKEVGVQQVKEGKIDAFFYYPTDVTKNPVEVYHKNDGLIENSKYETVAKQLLVASASSQLTPETTAIVTESFQTSSATIVDGEEVNLLASIIPPALFLVIFYAVIFLLSNQMLTSTIEEKENRVTEMILTSITSKTLIVGKIVALTILGVIQILVIAAVPILAYLILGSDSIGAPDISGLISNLVFDPVALSIAGAMFVFGFLLFTGFLVAIGAASPTAKEANSFFGFVVILIVIPFYFFSMLMTKTENIVVDILTYFPFTAPFTVLLRNSFGTIETGEALISIGIVAVVSLVTLHFAIQIFRYGTLEYSNRLSLKTIFGKK